MSKKTIEINDESIQKAYETLGIDINSLSLEKAKKEKEEDDDEEEEGEEKEEMKKAEELVSKKREELEKAESELAKLNKSKSSGDDVLIKALDGFNKEMSNKFEALITINKSLENRFSTVSEELEKAQETIEKAHERIEELENSSAGRKSITTEKFIEKAFQENEDTGKKMVSMSQHKGEIQGLLMEKAGLNGDFIEKSQLDSFWNNEMQYFEATNMLRPRAVERLFKEDNIQIVK